MTKQKIVNDFLSENYPATKYIKEEYIKNNNVEMSEEQIRNFLDNYIELYTNGCLNEEQLTEDLYFKFADIIDCDMYSLIDIVTNYMPENIKTYDFYYALVSKYAYPLKEVPQDFRDYKMCDQAVTVFDTTEKFDNDYAYEYLIKFVPKDIMDKPLVEKLIKNTEHNLNYIGEYDYIATILPFIPDQYKTKDIYDLVVKADPYQYQYVPDPYKTRKMLDYVLSFMDEGYDGLGHLLQFIPKEHLNHDICMKFIKDADYTTEMIIKVPEEFKDKELYTTAFDTLVEKSRYTMYREYLEKLWKLIPKEFKDDKMRNIITEIGIK